MGDEQTPFFLMYRTGSRSYQLQFGARANGDQWVRLVTGRGAGPEYTLTGSGASSHTYELVMQPSGSEAELHVDGALALSDYAGFEFSKNDGVLWGVGKSPGTGHINFALVELKLGVDHAASAPPSTWGSIKARYH